MLSRLPYCALQGSAKFELRIGPILNKKGARVFGNAEGGTDDNLKRGQRDILFRFTKETCANTEIP